MRVLIAGGGTGGHLIPALNIARELSSRHPDAEIYFIGTERGLEKEIVPEEGFPLVLLPVEPLSRKPSSSWIRFPIALLKSITRTISLLRRMDIDVVVAAGGYVAGPAVFAGWLTRKPVVLCEQNSYPGLTSRIGSLFARAVCLGLPGAKKHLWRKSRAVLTGNPVNLPRGDVDKAWVREKLGLKPRGVVVLITGGSQGAASINRAVMQMLERADLPENAQLLWQTGADKFDDIASKLPSSAKRVKVLPFIRPMWEAYATADIIVARCGALTLSEIAVFGLPAILVPYPYAAADHQRLNAIVFAEAGAAMVIQDDELTGKTLALTLADLIADDNRRTQMGKSAESLAKPNALDEIIVTIEDIASSRK